MTTEHPYQRIAESIRIRVRDGDLVAGERLPSIKELSDTWSVATSTVRNALTWLQQEGFIRTSPRGTFVADAPPVAPSARDRLERLRRTGSILAHGETKRVTHSGLVVPPRYVADLFDLGDGEQVLRREFVTGIAMRRTALAVSWHPAQFAAELPELLEGAPRKGDDLISKIADQTGRTIRFARDAMHARPASDREANYLGLPIGVPILALVHEWSDDLGIIEYGEWVLPPLVTIGYEYSM